MMQTIKPDALIIQSLTALIRDVGNQFLVSARDTHLDIHYVLRRIECEGLSFVTKTMPSFGKHFDASLEVGMFSPFPSFKKDRRGALPLIFRGLTNLVFRQDGTLLDDPDCSAIRLIRQLAYIFYKLEGDHPSEVVDEFIEDFVEVDNSLTHCETISMSQAAYINAAQDVITSIFTNLDTEEYIPRPGPGTTACKAAPWERFEPRHKYTTLHARFPYYRYFYSGSAHLLDRVHSYRRLPESVSGISRLAVVPKDSRGPRIICMEPAEYMWIQQGISRTIVSHLGRHALTRGHVNFDDQTVNGLLAMRASKDGFYATLDMKEASDRISADLVEILFDGVPHLRDDLLAASTNHIQLPNGALLQKKKFAPMGSALCFPVMSVCHYALILGILHVETGCTIKALAKHVYVFGDDIIVATEHAPILFEAFPLFGLKFNQNKSFYRGKFRESCGIDAYDGVNVTPKRVKRYAYNVNSPEYLMSSLAVFNTFFDLGCWEIAKVWQQHISSIFERDGKKLPYVTADSGIPGWIVPPSQLFRANLGRFRYDKNLQCLKMKVRALSTPIHCTAIGGWEQLLRWFTYSDENHLSELCNNDSASFTLRYRTKIVWQWKPFSAL